MSDAAAAAADHAGDAKKAEEPKHEKKADKVFFCS